MARRLAYASGAELRLAELDGSSRAVASPEPDETEVRWGTADFVAAEEMRRERGFWWSPAGEALAVTRVDEEPVPLWWIADPARPDRPPQAVRYPAAGTSNWITALHVVRLDGSRTEVGWDREALPYLAHVSWPRDDLLPDASLQYATLLPSGDHAG